MLSPSAQLSSRLPPEISDMDAIAEVARGNREMFAVIVRRYNPQLYRVGMAYLRNHALAEDAMQNAYVKAFLNLNRFQRGAAFATWLTRIMINECLMLLRSRKRLTGNVIPFDAVAAENAMVDDTASASDRLNLEEMKTLLERAVGALPRKYRTVYLLREVQQLSTAETAECLGISPENVKISLHRARERLKAELLKSAAGAELFAYPARFCDPLTATVMRRIAAV
jgi:RNA polymerase sigma factor (sigma-70 family)